MTAEPLIFHTSGSTGRAKNIVKTAESLAADARMLYAAFGEIFARCPTVVYTIDSEHMYGRLWCRALPELTGCPALPENWVQSPEEFFDRIEKFGEIVFITTPSFLEKLVCYPNFPGLSGRCLAVFTSGSLLRSGISAAAGRLLGVPPTEIFGSTETGSVAWRRQSEGLEWRVFEGVDVQTDSSRRLVVRSDFCVETPWVMGDLAELLPDRRFLLMGRADRCVKILERTVSLPEIDAALSAHPLVDQAYSTSSPESIPRVWTLVTLSPEGKSWLKQRTYRELRQSLVAFIAPKVENFARPRRIRVVEELPYTVQGKLPEAAVRPPLASCWQEPVVEVVERGPDKYVADLTFIPDAVYFQGHFPGRPILPGVAQLMVVQLMFRRHFRVEPSPGKLTRLKFMKTISPLQQVRLKIIRRADGSFDFSIDSEAGTHTSGAFAERRE